MSLTIKEELRRTFELATLRREAKDIQTPRQWRHVKDLMVRAEAARENETRLFAERYDTRVDAARRRLIDAAGTSTRVLQPRWIGSDRFDAAALLRQAHGEVRAHHDERLLRIDAAEARTLASIVEQSSRENALKGTTNAAFKRAADRRHVADRRRRTGPSQD